MEKMFLAVKEVLKVLVPILKKEDSKVGVKETKEALDGFNEVALVLADILKDGVQYSDALAFYNEVLKNDKLKEKVMKAYDGYKAIPGEIKDADKGEALELIECQLNYIPKYLEAFKK